MTTSSPPLLALLLPLLGALLGLGCSSAPSVAPIDDALLAEVAETAQLSIDDARRARDAANDALALAKSKSSKCRDQAALAEASRTTALAQLAEATLTLEIAEGSTPQDLEAAEARHAVAVARADYARELLTLRQREVELTELHEQLAYEEHRASIATVELRKAEALQDVDLVTAQRIPILDYRRQVTYHREEVAAARSRASTAEARTDEARGSLSDMRRKLDQLEKSIAPQKGRAPAKSVTPERADRSESTSGPDGSDKSG